MDLCVLTQTNNHNTEAIESTVLEQARLHRESQFYLQNETLSQKRK